jgi:hypothetical protein
LENKMTTELRVSEAAVAADPWEGWPHPDPRWENRHQKHMQLAGIPISIEGGLQIDPVVKEMVRLYNAETQNCVLCKSVVNAVAAQRGLTDDMRSKVMFFEKSDLPDRLKAALRIMSMLITSPQMIDDDVWAEGLRHFTEAELVDEVLFVQHLCINRVWNVLGTDPGAVDQPLYPSDSQYYGKSDALTKAMEALREEGLAVERS